MQRVQIPPLSLAIWIAGILLLAFVFVQTYRRRLYREFPFYFGYLAFHLLHTVMDLWIAERFAWPVAWRFHWGGEALDGPISALLIYEIFSKSLAPYGAVQKLGKILFFVSTFVLSTLGIWMLTSDSHSWPQKIYSAAISMDRSLGLVRVALLFLLFAFHRVLGLNWRHYLFGIAIGLSIASAGSLLSTTLRLQMGTSWWKTFVYLLPFSYDIGCVIWAYYLTSEESKVSAINLPPSNFLSKWNEAIQNIMAR